MNKLIFFLLFCIGVSGVWTGEGAREILEKARKVWEENRKRLKSYIAAGVKITRVLKNETKQEVREHFRLYVKGDSSKYEVLKQTGKIEEGIIHLSEDGGLATPPCFILLEEGGKCDKLLEDTLGATEVYVIEGTLKMSGTTREDTSKPAKKPILQRR